MLLLLLLPGGGSFVGDDALTASIERHQGNSDGYLILEMEEEVEGELYYYYSGKKETFDVSEEGDYELIAVGGRGGWCNNNSGGYGAQASGTFRLSKGDKLHIAVGGRGVDCNVEVVNFDAGVSETMYTGAGGAGGTFIELEDGTSETPKLLLAGGGGGGAGKHFGGEDGEDGPNGGWDWGGKNGEGGGLSCQDVSSCGLGFALIGGAGGAGHRGDGDSRRGTIPEECPKDNKPEEFHPIKFISKDKRDECDRGDLLAEGGKSFQKGGEGGKEQVDHHGEKEVNSNPQEEVRCRYRYINGGFGGFGGGGEGGIFFGGQWLLDDKYEHVIRGHTEQFEHGGGGGGGGYSGGGAGQFGGNGGAG